MYTLAMQNALLDFGRGGGCGTVTEVLISFSS